MKYVLLTAMLAFVCAEPALTDGRVTLFDSGGTAVAFIDTEGGLTVYSTKGEPLAYLDGGSIWGFNGRHLGWFSKGIIRDHGGYPVGCIRNAVSMRYKAEPPKGSKRPAPHRTPRQHLPPRVPDRNKWSDTPLAVLLAAGKG